MSDHEEEEEVEANADQAEQVVKPKIKKGPKGTKNKDGDYVVTAIEIPDHRGGMITKEKSGTAAAMDLDSDSDTEYDEEDDVKEAAPVTE